MLAPGLEFQSQELRENKFLFLKPLTLCILLWQPNQSNTSNHICEVLGFQKRFLLNIIFLLKTNLKRHCYSFKLRLREIKLLAHKHNQEEEEWASNLGLLGSQVYCPVLPHAAA